MSDRQVQSEIAADAAASEIAALNPLDEHNQQLAAHTHPTDWRNPTPSGRYNLVVIGAGPAGLVAAAGAAGLGAKVALIEKKLMGGDCLNVGCVPSKALIACARVAADVRDAAGYGVAPPGPARVDFQAVMERMRRLRADLSVHDSVERYTKLGVDVYQGEAFFTGPDTVKVRDAELKFSRALVTTGSRAAVPPIDGLEDAGYLTNETVFSLTKLPARLTIIGAGPIGCELAQAFARFGSEVTLIEASPRILPRDDSEAVEIVAASLLRDGVRLLCDAKVTSVRTAGPDKMLHLTGIHDAQEITADAILVGAGRVPNVEALSLAEAGIQYDPRQGIAVNDYLQTSNPKVYAAGDVASVYKFTHMADAMARIVLKNALFFGRDKVSKLVVPWCTYTDPEVAHVGMSRSEAEAQGLSVESVEVQMAAVDRAILDGDDAGFLRIHLKAGTDRILGATLVARHAGDMISEITGTMVAGKGLASLGKTLHPYPTQSEIIKKAADMYNRGRLTPGIKKALEKLLAWRR